MAVGGKYDVGRVTEVLGVYQVMDCDIIGLHETGVAASLLFLKLDVLFTAVVSPEATGKGRRAKVEYDWLFGRGSPVSKHGRRSSSTTDY